MHVCADLYKDMRAAMTSGEFAARCALGNGGTASARVESSARLFGCEALSVLDWWTTRPCERSRNSLREIWGQGLYNVLEGFAGRPGS